MTPRRVLLLGGGHAHLEVIRHAGELTRAGAAVTVVDRGAFWYSGMATGMLSGRYHPDQLRIDLAALCAAAGARLLRAEVAAIDIAAASVRFVAGGEERWDLLSCSLGSVGGSLPGADERVYAVKPLRRLLDLRRELERRFAGCSSGAVRVAVIGGGASGCEVAANLVALARARAGRIVVTIVAPGLLGSGSARAATGAAAALARLGVVHRPGRASGYADGLVRVTDGPPVEADLVVIATGLRPPALLRASGLPVDEDGALLVDHRLISIGDGRVLGGGNCVALEGHPLPGLGVFGVRQAPILRHNLHALLAGKKLRRYVPQRRWLQILNLGDRTGLATYGSLAWRGRTAWRLKDAIDRRFVRRSREA